MGRFLALLAIFAAVVTLSAKTVSAPTAIQPDRIWFSPAPGSLDYIDLFRRPQDWPRARSLTTVFKIIQQHTQMPPAAIVGPNTYDALSRAGVFRTLKSWGVKTAIEVGAVKEFYCTPDAAGMNASIANTVASVNAVRAAGGAVYYLAMDEPFLSGQAPVCGGPALEPTADRIATYVSAVHRSFPLVRVGLIEAYPSFSPAAFEQMLQLLAARDAAPAFLHVDVDMKALRPDRDDISADLRRLQSAAAARNIAFGVIVWGENGDADALYIRDAERIVTALARTFTWQTMPDQLIFQSWAQSASGLLITPTNLSEDDAYTHTAFLWDTFRRLRGETNAAGVAVPRR